MNDSLPMIQRLTLLHRTANLLAAVGSSSINPPTELASPTINLVE